MAIIVSRDGMGAERIEKAEVDHEIFLQHYIHDNPDILPVQDISDGTKLLVLAREFHTTSGPLDALGIDNEGHIYVIETKLLRNPDRRLIIAQVLDYGAALWKGYADPQDFVRALEDKCGRTDLMTKVIEAFNIRDDEAAALIEKVKINLQEGSIRFVLLMDKLHDHLKDLIVFMNQNSKFDFYGVELEFYRYEELGLDIMIPRIFGMGVRKDIGSSGSIENPVRIMNKQIMKDACEELNGMFENDMSCFTKEFHTYQSSSGTSAHLFADFRYDGSIVAVGVKLDHDLLKVGLYSWTREGRETASRLYNEHLAKSFPGLISSEEDANCVLFYSVLLPTDADEQRIFELVINEFNEFVKPLIEVCRS